jgi:hypothetical protein
LSLVEMRRKVARLGSSEVAVEYPTTLDPWFDGLVADRGESITPSKWVCLSPHREAGRFDVAASIGATAASPTGLDLGDALATF